MTRTEQHDVETLLAAAQDAEQSAQWDEALRLYDAALQATTAGDTDVRLHPRILRKIGRVHYERGDCTAATTAFEASLVSAQSHGNTADAASALNALAVVAQERGQLDVAEQLYEQAGAVAESLGADRLSALIDQNLGTLANIRGDLPTAILRYHGALQHFRAIGDTRASAWVLNNLGMLHVDVSEWGQAELCFHAAEELAQQNADPVALAKVESNRAELYLKRQQFDRARESCDRAFKIFSQLASDSGLGEVHKFYGMLSHETGKDEIAHMELGLALRLARACDNALLQAETQSERARVFVGSRQYQQALLALNEAYRIYCELDARREILDLKRRLEHLEQPYIQAIQIWAEDAPVLKLEQTSARARRVANYAEQLAAAVGYTDVVWLRVGAFLRDMGKAAVPKEILLKPGPLTASERAVVERHTTVGDDIVRELKFPEQLRPLVRNHHERWDGTGYPDRLERQEIPLPARILCIADAFDALTSERSFRSAFTEHEALEIMAGEAGIRFDPELFDVFEKLVRGGGAIDAAQPVMATARVQ